MQWHHPVYNYFEWAVSLEEMSFTDPRGDLKGALAGFSC